MNSAPNCLNIPADAPFTPTLVEWIIERYGADPLRFTQLLILLPTRRACSAVREGFLRQAAGRPMLLPRIHPIGDLQEEEAGFFADEPFDTTVENAISPVRRHLQLTQLVMRFEKASRGHVYNIEQAAQLASQLAQFLDEVERERLTFDGMDKLAPDALATHWQQTVQFLRIVSEHWPAMLSAQALVDPSRRRNRLLARIGHYWRRHPPEYPVIAAGSTGSQPATADLLAVIARLPHGSVILGGVDMDMPRQTWDSLPETHPQYAIRALLAHMDCPRDTVKTLGNAVKRSETGALKTLFQPAAETAQWTTAHVDNNALNHIQLVTADTQLDEARMIAIALRETLQTPGKTAALITPDRTLARMVIAQMQRFGIAIDDSAGLPLANTPAGAFLRLVINAVASRAAPVDVLALLRHPYAAAGLPPAECRSMSRVLELTLLRGVRPAPGFDALRHAANGNGTLAGLLEALADRSAAIMAYVDAGNPVSLGTLLTAHIALAEWLAGSDSEPGANRLWQGEDGQALAKHLAEIIDHADTLDAVVPSGYAGLFDVLLRSQVFRPSFGMHPRLKILSPSESRLQTFDKVILGELSEGTWPAKTSADPWMSRPMRQMFGLPAQERTIGQSALDIYLLCHAPEVLWTRARKIEGTPSIASRWWVRMETLLKNRVPERFAAMRRDTWFEEATAALDAPPALPPLLPPAPVPPLHARPQGLSVTAIDSWRRDPYVIYARHILRLRALPPLDQDPDAADFGTLVHRAMEAFITRYPAMVTHAAYDDLVACGAEAFKAYIDRPAVACLWWPRFLAMAGWIIEQEIATRAAGSRLYAEVKGRWDVPLEEGTFTLNTRIDRLAINTHGLFSITDYKTGRLPDDSLQLALEALIVEHGTLGIEGISPPLQQDGMYYWKLSGNRQQCEIATLTNDPMEALAELQSLIHNYRNPAQPYSAQTDPSLRLIYNDYEHLTRRQEWESV